MITSMVMKKSVKKSKKAVKKFKYDAMRRTLTGLYIKLTKGQEKELAEHKAEFDKRNNNYPTRWIPINLLLPNPAQPVRNLFKHLHQLLVSVGLTGVITHIVVCKNNDTLWPELKGRYWVLDGHRRGTVVTLYGLKRVQAIVLPAPKTYAEMCCRWKHFNSGGRKISMAEEWNSWSRQSTAMDRNIYLKSMSVTSPNTYKCILRVIKCIGMKETLRLARLNEECGSILAPSTIRRVDELLQELPKYSAFNSLITPAFVKQLTLWMFEMSGAYNQIGTSKAYWYPLTKRQIRLGIPQPLPEQAQSMLHSIVQAVTTGRPFYVQTALHGTRA